MQGVVFAHAASLLFSAPSTVSATSCTRTGAPRCDAMTSSRYSSADPELVVGVDGAGAVLAVEVALGPLVFALAMGRAHVLEEAVGGERA